MQSVNYENALMEKIKNGAGDPVDSQNQISKLLRLNAALLSEHKTGLGPAISESTLANAWLGCANVQKNRNNRDGQMDALARAFEFGAQFRNVANSWNQANPDKNESGAAYQYFYEQGLGRLRRGEVPGAFVSCCLDSLLNTAKSQGDRFRKAAKDVMQALDEGALALNRIEPYGHIDGRLYTNKKAEIENKLRKSSEPSGGGGGGGDQTNHAGNLKSPKHRPAGWEL